MVDSGRRWWTVNSMTDILKRVQNAAARLICQLKPRENVTPSLQQLHWLPVKQVQYKLSTIMYAVHHGLDISDITSKTAFGWHYKLCSTSDTDEVRRIKLSPMPALLHGTRYRMNFEKHLPSTASNANSRLIF